MHRWEYDYRSSDEDYDHLLDAGWEPFAVSGEGPWIIHLRRLVQFVCSGCGRDVDSTEGTQKSGVFPDGVVQKHWYRSASAGDVECEGGPVKRRPVMPKRGAE